MRGNYSAHRQIGRNNRGKHVDVFVGLFEGDAISWYPGTRGALDRDTMYPTTTAPLLGVECPIPARAEDLPRGALRRGMAHARPELHPPVGPLVVRRPGRQPAGLPRH